MVLLEDTGEQFEGRILGIYVLYALVLSFFLKKKLSTSSKSDIQLG